MSPSTANLTFVPQLTPAAPAPPSAGAEIGGQAIGELGGRAAGRQATIEQRIDGVLAGAGAGFACDRVLLYLLDDATTRLLPAHQWSVEGSEPVEDRRELASSNADVTAMAGNAIVLEDQKSVGEWPVPVWCEACVCLPVASEDTVHGTVWFTFGQSRAVGDAELGLMEIVAGRIALEAESLLELSQAPPSTPTLGDHDAARIITRCDVPTPKLAPSHSPVLDELELAGWSLDRDQPTGFYDWHALADGRMLIASAAAAGSEADTELWLQAARIALRSHAATCCDAGELLTIASDTLWTSSPGGQGMSLAVALLDTADASGSLALAGNAVALRWRAGGCVPIVAESAPAGWNQSSAYLPRECSLLVRERLVLATLGGKTTRLDRLCRQLQSQSAEAQRRMHARGALRTIIEAGSDNGCDLRGATLVRRR